jgi:hypothetical protein
MNNKPLKIKALSGSFHKDIVKIDVDIFANI